MSVETSTEKAMNAWQQTVPRSLVFLLILLMFSRVLSTSIGLPKIVDFIHFFVAGILFLFFLVSSPKLTREARVLLLLLVLFFFSVVLSTVWSGAGVGNAILDILILGEPFMVLVMLISYRWKNSDLFMLKKAVLFILLVHIAISYFELVFLGEWQDDIQGLFQKMGAGHHISGAIALTGAIFFFRDQKLLKNKVLKYLLLISGFGIIYITDSKQVVAVFAVAFFIIIFIGTINIKKKIAYFLPSLLLILIIILLPNEWYSAYLTWLKKDLLIMGVIQKLSVFSIIFTYSNSIFDYVFGFGPGHTVGKLAFMIPSYYDILSQFGITLSPITNEVWMFNQGNYISNSITGSSMFMLFYLWPALFGDLGLFGLFTYLAILWYLWLVVSTTTLQKLLILTIVGFGTIFTWVEEPQFIVFILVIVGIMWQEQNSKPNSSN